MVGFDEIDGVYEQKPLPSNGVEIRAPENKPHVTHFTVCIYAIPSGNDKPFVLLTFPDQIGVDMLIRALKQDKTFNIKTRLRVWINIPITKPFYLKTEIPVDN